MLIMALFLLVMVNISLVFHYRKIDRSTSEADMKGYTWKSNLIAIGIGVMFGLVMIVINVFYIISRV